VWCRGNDGDGWLIDHATKDAAALADHDGNFRTDRLVSSIVKRETLLK
jgi:hypothetical protein